MKILITGGAGFIGSHLAEKLLALNYAVINVDNFNDYYDPAIKESNIKKAQTSDNYQLFKMDITDFESLEHIFQTQTIDVIIHLAARAGVRPSIQQPFLYNKVNIEGTLNLLELSKKYKVEKFLFASSSSVYGNNTKVPFSEKDNVDYPVSPYAATKKAGELLCYNYHHLYGLKCACLRFFTVYGPRQRPEMAIHKFTRLIQEQKELPVFNNGECLRDFTYIDDIIQGILNILHSDFTYDIINLGESATISTKELILLIEKELNKQARINFLPPQPGDVEKTYADITHAKTNYKYKPAYPISKGIKNFIHWYLANTELVRA